MAKRTIIGRVKRASKRIMQSKRRWLLYPLAVIMMIAVAGLMEGNSMNADYSKLLSTIAEGESRGNYNAHFGNPYNQTIRFTDMKVADVLQWQREYVAAGNPSNAVGKYQFIEPTLRGLIREMRIDHDAVFDETLQDALAVRLLERRGVEEYLKGNISTEEFAHNLSKEWAALPRVMGANPQASYYDGDGLNKVQISIDEVLLAISSLRPSPNG